jgi:tRNA(Ile)-lysidine synthase
MIDPTEKALNLWDHHTQSFLASQGWNPSGSLWLLAVSGGADSTALLHWARRAAPLAGASIAVAHVNHGLRPGARAEAEFVSALCRRFGIPCFTRDLDPAQRLPRESVEMWARRERYAFFEAAAETAAETAAKTAAAEAFPKATAVASTGADIPVWILTAHHRDDLVETVFQRLGRGTGPRGLRGIPFRRGRIVRPFLDRSRAEILAYLDLLGASWSEDESNADTAIDRNWYRHRFLPRVRREEPDLDARILKMALDVQAIGKGIDALEEQEGLLRTEGRTEGRTDGQGPPYLDLEGFAAKAEAGDLEALDFWVRRLVKASPEVGGRPMQVTKEILREACRQWKEGPDRLQVPLNARLALKRRKQGIYCVEIVSRSPAGSGPAKKSCPPMAQRVILDGGSAHATWQWGERIYALAARRYPRPMRLEFPQPTGETAIFDADLFSCTLLIRTRKAGDRFSPLGMRSRSRKLKTFFNEEKVPIGMRDDLPIIIAGESENPDDGTPAWVPGLGISDFFKVSGSTSHILELVLTCENP